MKKTRSRLYRSLMAQEDMILYACEGITGSRAASKLERLGLGDVKAKRVAKRTFSAVLTPVGATKYPLGATLDTLGLV